MHAKSANFIALQILIFLLLLLSPGTVWAAFPFHATDVVRPVAKGTLEALACYPSTYYAVLPPDSPRPLASLLGNQPKGIAIGVCQDFEDNTHYFLRDIPPPNLIAKPVGICYVQQEEIFPGTSLYGLPMARALNDKGEITASSLSGWTIFPPAEWKARGYDPVHLSRWPIASDNHFVFAELADVACPLGNDPNYLAVGHVPPGLLKQILAYFKAITQSDASFTAAMTDAKPQLSPQMISYVRNAPITGVDCDMTRCILGLRNAWLLHLGVLDNKIALLSIERPPP